MHTLHVGSARVDRAEELSFPVSTAWFDSDEDIVQGLRSALPGGYFDPVSRTFDFVTQTWIIRVDGLTVLVDTCTGNRRVGRGQRFDGLDVPFLERLADAGVRPGDVDLVFLTHLHHDHCGWNVHREGDAWIPTFSGARHIVADAEAERWDPSGGFSHPNVYNPNVFDECMRPLVEAGLVDRVATPHALSDSLTVLPAPGHTEGHSILRLESEGMVGYFVGDTLHHPAQITDPRLHLPGCDDLQQAIDTRRLLLDRIRGEDAFIFPAHFSTPHYGRVVQRKGRAAFSPGGLPAVL